MVAQVMHAGLAKYLATDSVDAGVRRGDGSVHLIFDKQYRVAFITAPKGALWLESRVCELPADRVERQSCLRSLLEKAGSDTFMQAAGLTLAQDGNLLIVQQLVPAEAGVQEFEQYLEKFINLLAIYRSLAGVL